MSRHVIVCVTTTIALSTTPGSSGGALPAAASVPDAALGSDAELVTAAREGDEAAFGKLVERYSGTARRIARSILGNEFDADDAAQDAFLAAWNSLERFNTTRPFRPWLMRIVVNAATDVYRRRKVRHGASLTDTVADSTPGPDRETDLSILRSHLAAALAELPERQRIAVTMFDSEGYCHGEISEVLGDPVGTVRSLVFHGRRALRKTLAPYWREKA